MSEDNRPAPSARAACFETLGSSLLRNDQPRDALAAFQEALDVQPQHQAATVGLAKARAALGRGDQAREVLAEVGEVESETLATSLSDLRRELA